MATKDRKKLQHIHSSIADKQPTPQSLEVGEIAVNNSAKKEFLSIKNSDDKVVRFSSDSTIIDWIEKKEVMPYSGVVDNVHLDTNRSNIEIKINQVAAKNTPKYDKINGAVDIDGQPVNPSTDGGKTDGAGIAIDMSRYAMIGANPSFSSVTVTHRSNLSGTTNISNGAGGEVLNMTTTNVNANNANWTETITNKKSTVTAEEDKIGTLNESATTRTTTVGTEKLTVSGTTTEVHTGNVTITNSANVTSTTNGTTTETKVGNVVENHSGTTIENKKGDVTENNLANKTENTTGAHKLYTTSDTCIVSQANANFYGKVSTNIGVACDGTTKGSATTVVGTTTLNMSGATTTISGNTTNVTGATTLNLSGNTINERALTANTNVTSAYTSATTATTVIGTANTSATTATLSGNTLDITEATRLSAKTPSTYVSGTNLSVVETNTDIESCGRISGKTNAFTIQECATGSGKTVINQTDIKASGKTLSFDETTSISAKTPSITLSGTNLTINEANTVISSCTKIDLITNELNLKQCTTGSVNFDFCSGFGVNSNNIKLHQCGSAGTISISAQTQNINGGNLTVNESGNTALNTTGTTTIKSTGNTNVETNGANNKVTIQASGNGGDVEVFAKDTLCASGVTAAFNGTTKTNIGKNCADGGQTTTLNLNGTTINETGTTVNISGSTSANVSGATVNVSGGNICETAAATAAFVGATTTNIGSNCSGGGNTAALNVRGVATNISAGTLTETVTGATNETHTGSVSITNGSAKTETTTGAVTENNKDGYTVNTTGDTCLQSTVDVNVGGAANTNIGTNCDDSVKANYVNIKAKSGITETANTVTISGTASANISGATVNVSGGTTNISGGSINETSSGKTCIQAGTDLNIGGDATTNVGTNCAGGVYSNNVNIYAQTAITETAATVNISGSSSANVSGATVNVSGGTTTIKGGTTVGISGATTNISGATTNISGGSINETSTGKTCIQATDATNGILNVGGNKATNVGADCAGAAYSDNTTIYATSSVTISTPKTTITGDTNLGNLSATTINAINVNSTNISGDSISANNLTSNVISSTTISGDGVSVKETLSTSGLNTTGIVNLSNIVTIDPAEGQCVTIDRNLCVQGTVTSQQQIYSSDRNLKENINLVTDEEMDKVDNINYKSYNFKNDENKNKIYGVIAQDVQEAGLNELVYTNEDGNLAVDYTSLMILKLAHLRRVNYNLVAFISNLDNRMAQLENKNKELESKIEELEGKKD